MIQVVFLQYIWLQLIETLLLKYFHFLVWWKAFNFDSFSQEFLSFILSYIKLMIPFLLSIKKEIVTGLIDEIRIVEVINQKLGVDNREKITA